MIFIDVVKSKWAIILNCQHIIKYESGKRVQSCSRLKGECSTGPGVVPPSPSWCCQHKPHLDEWGDGEPKTRNQLRKITAFLSIVTAAAQLVLRI